jgi:hypothetical protein
MVSLEQIKLLESKIVKAIGFVTQLTEENVRLKKRNEELGEIAARLKDEKIRVEEGIVSALDSLNRFEDAIERSISTVKASGRPKGGELTAETMSAPVPTEPSVPAASASAASASAPAARNPVQGPPAEPIPSIYTVEEIDDDGETELDLF